MNQKRKETALFMAGKIPFIIYGFICVLSSLTQVSDLIQKIKQKFTWYTILKKTILCKIHANKKYPNSI